MLSLHIKRFLDQLCEFSLMVNITDCGIKKDCRSLAYHLRKTIFIIVKKILIKKVELRRSFKDIT